MPNIRRNQTSRAGLRSYSDRHNTTTTTITEPSTFTLARTEFPLGTPINSKRSRKHYSELADEREYLKHLKEIWTKKLQALKEDHQFLTRMKNLEKKDIKDIPPLFSQEDDEYIEKEASPEPVSKKPRTLITSLEQLNKLETVSTHEDQLDDDDKEQEEEEEEEEDDEEIQRKLHLALQQYNFS